MTLKSEYKKISLSITRYTGWIDCNSNTANGGYLKRRFVKFNDLF